MKMIFVVLFNQHGCRANHHIKSVGIPVGLLAVEFPAYYVKAKVDTTKSRKQTSKQFFRFPPLMLSCIHIDQRSRLLRVNEKALEISSLNIKKMLRFIYKRQRLDSYHYQITIDVIHIKQEKAEF